jgi:short-subunit dehydrogenase
VKETISLATLGFAPLLMLSILGLTALGFVVYLKLMLSFLAFINRHLLRRQYDLQKRYGPNSWACITGSTSGIGEAFAKNLAQQGFNLILLGRDEQKLEITKSIMKSLNNNIEAKTIVADFERTDLEFYRNIGKQINEYDVSLLVNDAAYDYKEDFLNISDVDIQSMIDTNCKPYALLTRYVAEKMMARSYKSGIINVSSVEAKYLDASDTVYASTKAFTDFFSRGLNFELKEKIDVLSLRPGTVSTKMTGLPASTFTVTKPDATVKDALRDLGHEVYTYGNWRHDISILIKTTLDTILPLNLFQIKGYKSQKKQSQAQKEFWIKNDTTEAHKDRGDDFKIEDTLKKQKEQ